MKQIYGSETLPKEIWANLRETPEQQTVVGPFVAYLELLGWQPSQIRFGRSEWRVPKTPSEAFKRERGAKFDGFPCDIVVFDDPTYSGDYDHVSIIIECKQSTISNGVSQLEQYMSREPSAKLGIWCNSAQETASAAFIYRDTRGKMLPVSMGQVRDMPMAGSEIAPLTLTPHWCDLRLPSARNLKLVIQRLLDRVVVGDPLVTRREEQLDQLCSVLLLKLFSDKEASIGAKQVPFFRPMESDAKTAQVLREKFKSLVREYPDVFTEERDRILRFANDTLALCVKDLYQLRLLDIGVSSVSMAFQVLRSEALKQGEGQYFTPSPILSAGVQLARLTFDDFVIDPACGTGGFLVEVMSSLSRMNPDMPSSSLTRWAQTHICGIDKDPIGVKLAKVTMQIAGDGSAHVVRGDSLRVNRWPSDYTHLMSGDFKDGRFTVVLTNPPFGKNLVLSPEEARLAGLEIAREKDGTWREIPIGLAFLNRCHKLLARGGRLGIVLPETYFFSSDYEYVFSWMQGRLEPEVVADIPMEAFQDYCRAKTNFYLFRKRK